MQDQTVKKPLIARNDRAAFLIAAGMIVILIVAFCVFAVRQTEANRKIEAEIANVLISKTFIRDDMLYDDLGVYYEQRCEVSFSKDGTASIVYSYDSENKNLEEENMSSYKIVEEHNRDISKEPWSVHISLLGKITVQIGNSRFAAHQDEFGKLDYLLEDQYKIYYAHTKY